MSKVATIASLVRVAARTEAEFTETVQQVLDEKDPERLGEFFDRLNIPRSVGAAEGMNAPLPEFTVTPEHITDFGAEQGVSDGIQKFLDRHVRKIKWHATHPSVEGTENVMLVMRASMATDELRLDRLQLLLRAKGELTPREWATAREIMNRSYLTFRNFLTLLVVDWAEAMNNTVGREQLVEKMGPFHEVVDAHLRSLEEHRDRIEERRQELTVIPEEFPPVKPPNYFGGDLLGPGPWKQYWEAVNSRAHQFREALG